MNKPFRNLALVVALTGALVGPALANPDQLAQKKNCMACHAIDKKLVGPSFKDVANRYKGQADAVAKLSQRIIKGGSGNWGAVPMPANNVTEAEARQLAQWVLSRK